MNSFLWNYMMLHLTTDTLHDQIGLVTDWRAKTGRCRHTDHHEERRRVHTELRSDRQGDRETERRSRIVRNQFRKDIGDDKDYRQ